MKRKTFSAVTLAFLLASSQIAYAQWIYQKQENAFDPTLTMHLGLTMGIGGYALALRCQNNERSIVFMTPEKAEDVSVLNAASPKLLIRIDENEIFELNATLESQGDNVLIVAQENDQSAAVFRQVEDAKSRTSAALKILGQTMHATNFNVRGSTRTVQELNGACGE